MKQVVEEKPAPSGTACQVLVSWTGIIRHIFKGSENFLHFPWFHQNPRRCHVVFLLWLLICLGVGRGFTFFFFGGIVIQLIPFQLERTQSPKYAWCTLLSFGPIILLIKSFVIHR